MQLRDAWRSVPTIVLMTSVSGGVAFGVSTVLPKTYRAEAQLAVGRLLLAPGPSYDDLLISESLSITYAELATTRPIVAAAIERLNLDLTPEGVSDRIEAQATAGSFIELAVEDQDPARAAALANALAQELVEASPRLTDRQLRAEDLIAADLATTSQQIDDATDEIAVLEADPARDAAAQARLDRLKDRVVSLQAARATLLSISGPSSANVVTLVEEAVAITAPVSPRPSLNAVVGAVAGLALAVAGVYLRTRTYEPARRYETAAGS